MGSRAKCNQQYVTSTPVDKHEVRTKLTHEILLTALVEAVATIKNINMPSSKVIYQYTVIIDSGATSSCE